MAAAAAAAQVLQHDDNVDNLQEWVDVIFRPDTDVLALSRKAELVVAFVAFVFAMALHSSMFLYAVVRRRHMEEEAVLMNGQQTTTTVEEEGSLLSPSSTRVWNAVLRCWFYSIHCNAVLFYLVPLLTLLSFSPLLWIFVTYLLMGVIFHQWSLLVLTPSSKSILKWSRRQRQHIDAARRSY